MELVDLQQAVADDAVWVAFANVLAQQLGLPVPAVPTLLMVGSLAGVRSTLLLVLLAAVAASVLADAIWYAAGRAFGYRILTGLCRLSINPGTCVTQTEDRFVRWGVWSLVVAKFVPGFSTVAPPIAGTLKMPLTSFLVASGIGAALWAGLALAVGWMFRDQLQLVLGMLSGNGTTLMAVLILVPVVWIAWKLRQKRRFERDAAIPRMAPETLLMLLASPSPPLVLDLRGSVARGVNPPVSGARAASVERLDELLRDWPRDALVVTLCACPQDATAIDAAHRIMKRGYTNVMPLQGGYDALMRLTGGQPAKQACR